MEKSTKIKTETLEMNNNQPHQIQTPKTVEEFRNNLRKYFVCVKDEVYLESGKGPKIDQMNSLLDLYGNSYEVPWVSVKVNTLKDFREFMRETNQVTSMYGYFLDENNYEVIESQNDYLMDYDVKWVGIDNQLYREFFFLTLGAFSGYVESKNKDDE